MTCLFFSDHIHNVINNSNPQGITPALFSSVGHHDQPAGVRIEAVLYLVVQVRKIGFEQDLLRQFLLLQEHQHIDREVGDLAVCFDVAVTENVALFDAVVFYVQHVIHRVVAVIILAGFNLDRQDPAVLFDHEVKLAELFAVVVIERISVRGQFLGGDVFVNGTEVDRRFVLQDLELDLVPVLCGEQTDVVREQFEKILRLGEQQRYSGLVHHVRRERDAGVLQPQETIVILVKPRFLVQIFQDEALVFRVQLAGDQIEDLVEIETVFLVVF